MSEVSLPELVRRAAAEHPDLADPRALVPFVLEEIIGREGEMLERLLPTYVATVLRRRGTVKGGEEWDAFLAERVPTSHGTVFARDASAAELDAGAARRRSHAGALDKRAESYARVASAMRGADVATAGDLNPELGALALRELEIRLKVVRRRRMKAEARLREVTSLRTARDRLRALVGRGESPLIPALRKQRDDLLAVRDSLHRKLERRALVDTFVEEAVNNGQG